MSALKEHRQLLFGCVMFLGLGLATAALGPVLPELAANTASSLSEVGAIFTMIFLGAFLSQIVAGPLMDQLGQRPVLVVGLSLLAAGLLGLSLSHSLLLTLSCALIGGLGHGAVDVGGNVMIAASYAARRVSALNLLNLFFGIGAVAGPAVASLSLRIWGMAIPTLWLSVALLAALLPFVMATATARDVPPLRVSSARLAIYGAPLLWVFGLVLLLYVGTENGMGGWTTTYINRTTPLGLEGAALVTSGFWLMLTVGRMLAVVLGLRFAPNGVLLLALVGSFASGVLLAASTGNALLSIMGVLALGFFFGPIFPTVLAVTTASFPSGPGKAASVVVVFGSIGGMLLPWTQGILLERQGPFSSILFVCAGTAAMLALFGAVSLARWRALMKSWG